MDDFDVFVILLIIGVLFIIWIEWVIGKFIGENVSRTTGILLGIVFIIFGFSFLTGISCILYSQQNANAPIDINASVNQQQPSSDIIECPYCAESIKKNAKICRYCNNKL